MIHLNIETEECSLKVLEMSPYKEDGSKNELYIRVRFNGEDKTRDIYLSESETRILRAYIDVQLEEVSKLNK